MQEWVEGEKGPWMEDGEKLLTIGLQCSVLQVLDSGEACLRNEPCLLLLFSLLGNVVSLRATCLCRKRPFSRRPYYGGMYKNLAVFVALGMLPRHMSSQEVFLTTLLLAPTPFARTDWLSTAWQAFSTRIHTAGTFSAPPRETWPTSTSG